jgi:hypothetical protein
LHNGTQLLAIEFEQTRNVTLATIGTLVIRFFIKNALAVMLSARNACRVALIIYKPGRWGEEAAVDTGGFAMIA